MYPAAIEEYVRPGTIQEAIEAMGRYDEGDALFIAGGQSLMQAIKTRLVRPRCLVDLQSIAELSGITVGDGSVKIGAMTKYRDIAKDSRLDGTHQALRDAAAPVVAVSPIVAGRAIKGPTAKMMHELGLSVSVSAIAEHYAGWLDGLVIDDADAPAGDTIRAAHIAVLETKTVMRDLDDRVALAADVLGFVDRLRREAGGVLQTASGAVPTEDDASCAHSG